MKLAGIHTVPINIGDFISGTMHMDTLEKGAYIMLLFAHYQIGESGLPNDPKKLSRIAGVSQKVWDRISPTIADKFTVTSDFWIHSKCVDTLRKVHQKSSSQRDKALKKHNSGHAAAEPRQSHTKPNTKDIDKSISPPLIPPEGKTKKIQKPDDVSDVVWQDFIAHRKAKRATVTETVIRQFRKQADMAGVTLEQAIERCIAMGWQGYKADWDKNRDSFQKKETYSEGILRAGQMAMENLNYKRVEDENELVG